MAILLTVASVGLHVTTFRYQGALWRDEANAVEMGRMTLRQAWAHLPFDSILMGPILVLRAMALAGLSANDTALRALGMTLGLAVLVALWWAALHLSGHPPLVALLLFGLSPVGVRYGDSLRAYPFVTLTLVVAFALLSRAARDPSVRAVTLASLAAAAAVQCSYLSAVLIGALCAGGLIATFRFRSLRRTAAVLVPGLAAVASLLVYRERMQASWAILDVQVRPLRIGEVVEQLSATLATPSRLFLLLWLAGLAAGVVAGVYRVSIRSREDRARDVETVAFLGTALCVAVLLYLFFLKRVGVEPHPWHFTPLLAFSAVSLDGLVGLGAAAAPFARVALAALVAVGGLAAFPEAERFTHIRKTNIDRVAAVLTERAAAGDLVVVSPYHSGISFQRYYHGAAEWTTLPPVNDHRVHRYDLLKAAMVSRDPLAPVLRRAKDALSSGHRVFVVVDVPIFQKHPAWLETPPVPNPDWGWHAGFHFRVWALQFGYFLQTHATRGGQVVLPGDEDVSPYERMLLIETEGYASRGADSPLAQ